ncbi:MAG: hypothetical protein ACKVPY_12380 [Paracoccaceae bacterium]
MRKALLLTALAVLAACKAEKVEISLDSGMIVAAADGVASEVSFEATLGEQYSTVDDEKRAQIESVKSLIEKYFPGVEVNVDIGSDEYRIEVDGSLAVSKASPSSGAPWHVSATRATEGEGIVVQLLPAASFGSFKAELQEVNMILGADEYQPVEFNFTAPSGIVLVGGAIVDGFPTGIARIPMNGQTIRMLFKEGVWENTSGTFLYIP